MSDRFERLSDRMASAYLTRIGQPPGYAFDAKYQLETRLLMDIMTGYVPPMHPAVKWVATALTMAWVTAEAQMPHPLHNDLAGWAAGALMLPGLVAMFVMTGAWLDWLEAHGLWNKEHNARIARIERMIQDGRRKMLAEIYVDNTEEGRRE